MALTEKQELMFISEKSTLTVVSVGAESDGDVCQLHIILAWARLISKQTPPMFTSPKVYCFRVSEQENPE